MVDRVSASITLGGSLITSDYAELCEIIADEGLSTEWDGPDFAPEHRVVGEPLGLCAHEVSWGRFEMLEAWCVDHKVPFARWSGACPGQWGAERVVFTGEGEPQSYSVDEEDYVLVGRDVIRRLGSLDAIFSYFDAADFTIPRLSLPGDPSAEAR